MSSTFQIEHNRLLGELREVLKTDIARITGKANGGRSILLYILLKMMMPI